MKHPNAGEMFEWSCHGFDSYGNIINEVFNFKHPKHSATDPPGSVVTDEEYTRGIELISHLDKPVVCTGNPELYEFEVAGIRASVTQDYSTGFDFQQAVLTIFPKISRDINSDNPFSISQDYLTPCNGIARRPKHFAVPDDFYEAVCMMGMMRLLLLLSLLLWL